MCVCSQNSSCGVCVARACVRATRTIAASVCVCVSGGNNSDGKRADMHEEAAVVFDCGLDDE